MKKINAFILAPCVAALFAITNVAVAEECCAESFITFWVPDSDGNWSDGWNWNFGEPPLMNDWVSLDVGGWAVDRTITHSSGTDRILNLNSQENLVISGGLLDVYNQTYGYAYFSNYVKAATISGSGVFGLNDIPVETLTQTGGALTGSGATVNNAYLSGGVQSGPGTTTLLNSGTISGNGLGLNAQRVFRNQGTLNWSAGLIELNMDGAGGAGRLENAAGAVIDAQGNNSIQATDFGDLNTVAGFPAFDNAGTFRKSAGIGTTTIDTVFSNTGEVEILSGRVQLRKDFTNEGRIYVENGAQLASSSSYFENGVNGLIEGTGTIDPYLAHNLTNNGILSPGHQGVGLMTIAGGFEQTANGLLDFEIARRVDNSLTTDGLSITGNATLDGTLKLEQLTDGFAPQAGDLFTLLFFSGSRMGQFATIDTSAFAGLQFNTIYNDHSVQVQVLAAPVPIMPSAWLLGSGLFCLLCGQARKRNGR